MTNSLSFFFIYKKKDERQRERKKETEKIKIEIRPSQFQTTIIFDRKFRLRCATRLRKSYDEIYGVNAFRCYGHFRAKKYRLDPQKRI
jgi:hypothetical protein